MTTKSWKPHFLLRTKSLDGMIAETKRKENKMVRALGPWQVTMLGIGSIIGAGIFATVGTAVAGDSMRPGAGPGLMVSFVLTAIVCALVAVCYAELASMIPISGSAYTYSYATMGELVAWIIGWDLVIEYGVSAVAVAISWSSYLNALLRGFGLHIPGWLSMNASAANDLDAPAREQVYAAAPEIFGTTVIFDLPAAIMVVLITLLLIWGISQSAKMNAAMVILNIIALSLFILVGAFWVRPDNWVPFAPNGWAGISAGAAIVFFAFIGFDAVSTIAEETKNPQRNLPIGIIASLIVVSVFYISVAAIFTGLIPFDALKQAMGGTEAGSPLTMALHYASPKLDWLVDILAAGAVIAQLAVVLVVILAQTRIFSVMSRDGLLPPVFCRLHPKFRTPFWSTVLTGGLVAFFAAVTSLETIIDLTNIGTLFAFVLVSAGVIVLRVAQPDRPRNFRVPGGWLWALIGWCGLALLTYLYGATLIQAVVFLTIAGLVLARFREFTFPLLAIFSCLYLVENLPITSFLRFVAWFNIGLIIYCGYGVFNSRLNREVEIHDPAHHHLRLSIVGAWLAISGVLLAVVVRAFQIFATAGLGPDTMPPDWEHFFNRIVTTFSFNSWMEIDWFFLVPLIGNGLILCPLLFYRVFTTTADHKAAKLSRRRQLALAITGVLTFGTIIYLAIMIGVRLG